MKIVGSYLGIHDNGFSLIENNNIIACYSEERFSRIKSTHNQYSFPINSLTALQEDFNIDIYNKDIIFATAKPVSIEIKGIVDIIKKRPIKLYSHQYAHACGAYYTSGFGDNTLVISYDGGDCGDDNFTELNKDNLHKYHPYKINTYSATFIVKDGKLIEVGEKQKHGSVAHLWPVFCNIFGLQHLKDEGKIMGLAAQGKFNDKIFNQLKFFGDNNAYGSAWMILGYYHGVLNGLSIDKQWELKRDLAYNLQHFTEITMTKYVDDLNKKYGPFKNLCLAGGIFSNVKLNQKLNEELSFDNIWVYPAMTDEGLSLGTAIACGVEMGTFSNRKIDNVFFGKKYTRKEVSSKITKFFSDINKKVNSEKLDYNKIAKYLVDGKVVGLFDGASEYGPRALGNRSIMVEPTKKETHKYLNSRLGRDEIMPFAPIILEEHIDDVCEYGKSKHTSEFMTMCYNVKDKWLDKIPAVINTFDNTARPQIVNKKRNKHFYNILYNYYELSGVPALMNTSFNGHGEPIINSPEDALKHLVDNTIDYLIINNKIYNIEND